MYFCRKCFERRTVGLVGEAVLAKDLRLAGNEGCGRSGRRELKSAFQPEADRMLPE